MCTAKCVSLNRRVVGKVAYCHAMSISKVGTKKAVGVEAIRSRNLVKSVSCMKHGTPLVPHVRVVSGNTMMQRNLIFLAIKKSCLAPTKLVHLVRERVLSEDLLSTTVSSTGEMAVI